MHCDVVIVGYRLNAKEPAPKALERILGLFAEDARKLARSFPATVLSAGSQEQAERLMEQLSAAGALVELRESKPMPAPVPRQAAQTVRAKIPRNSLPTPDAQGAPASTDKISLDLAPTPKPRDKQRTDQHKAAPPPPPAAALYQLGDFGLAAPRAGGSLRPGAPLAVPLPPVDSAAGFPLTPPPGSGPRTAAARRASMAGGMDLDLELSGMPLELETDDVPVRARMGSGPGSTPNEDLHSLGERFSDSPAPVRGPVVEERAFRAIQRAPRAPDSRRPGVGKNEKPGNPLLLALREWAPATVLFAFLSFGSTVAVGYALDPDDPVNGLTHAHEHTFHAAPTQQTAGTDGNLHPLLRATPLATRAPLAAILRARIPGVHDVAVLAKGAHEAVHCAVIEHAEGETETRLAQVRETGREVSIPGEVAAQLHEQERVLRSELKRADLTFSEICLAL